MHFDATFFALVALIIFLAIAAYAGAFKKMGAGLDSRADRIRKELEQATQLRKDAEALLAEYKQKRLDAEKEAASIISAARADAEDYAAETRRKLTESLERRSRQAEQKIAQAEAAAIKDVRSVATDLAIAASHHLAAEAARGEKGAELIAQSIGAVKNRLN
ncbi:ATP F0F1 synthase subunit B [Aestuariivirga sp.]|uniref:F0F1 ATP synthase subunit B family protein n=1 Tax=Aestuariivirga sp. TaxID=2650926 RepID=UPI0025B832DA|nr:ATP F0F1 synthase subunit B [Aestuariivirga sp.]MCA3554570.1 ATP F0F1 synthase subunit B [Aestuariivirga sp.]